MIYFFGGGECKLLASLSMKVVTCSILKMSVPFLSCSKYPEFSRKHNFSILNEFEVFYVHPVCRLSLSTVAGGGLFTFNEFLKF